MPTRRTLILTAAAIAATRALPARAQDDQLPPPPPSTEFVAVGFSNPRDLAFGPDGALYVAEAGGAGTESCYDGPEGYPECWGTSGAIARIAPDGTIERILTGVGNRSMQDTGMNAIGPHGLAFVDDTLYLLTGLSGSPDVRDGLGPIGADLGRIFLVQDGTKTEFADIAGHEATANPAGGTVDANPFDITALPDGTLAVVDTGGNDLMHVAADGTVTTLATFADRDVTLPDGSTVAMQAVPSAVELGPDGLIYVGTMTGQPFPVGEARVFTVPLEGGEPTEIASGFTNIIDLTFDDAGNLYVLEWAKGGLGNINPEDPTTMEGQLTRIAPDGTRTVLAGEQLILPTVAEYHNGAIYLANYGTLPEIASIVRLPLGTA